MIYDNKICEEGVKSLAGALRVNESIQILDLSGNKIGPEGAKHLADALKNNQSLTKITLANNQIGDNGVKSLAGALMINKSVKTLDLGSNNIGVEGAKHLADALKVNQSLQDMLLDCNRIGDNGAKCFADTLKVNKSLQTLHLNSNNIGNNEVISLADALKINGSVETLWLHGNKIGDEGANSLASSFKVNKCLRLVWLNDNCINDSGAQNIAKALQHNISIEEICLYSNGISRSIRNCIDAITKNPARMQLQKLIQEKDDKIASKNDELLDNEKITASMKQEIASLKADMTSPVKLLENLITNKDNEIKFLKAKLENSKPIIDTVDLTTNDTHERANKRPRQGNVVKSSIAIQHKSNQKLAHFKQEKEDAVANLKTAQDEKQAVEVHLEKAKDDLEDSNETLGYQTRATDIWQGRFDELVSLVEAGQVDGAAISAIRNRPMKMYNSA